MRRKCQHTPLMIGVTEGRIVSKVKQLQPIASHLMTSTSE